MPPRLPPLRLPRHPPSFSSPPRTTSIPTRTFFLPPHASPAPHSPRAPSTPHAYTPTPFITEQVGGAIYTSDIFSRLLKERIIVLNGAVDDALAASIVAQLLFLEADAPAAPISLYINSPGGAVSAGLAIYDTMAYIRAPVSTICLGQAASMGSLLLAGGAPGRRFALPNASVMVHQPSGGYFGQASDIAIHAKEILRVRERLNRIYQRHLQVAGKDRGMEEIEKLMERDYFMGAEEAKEVGIIDEVLERREDEEAATAAAAATTKE